MRKLTTLGLTTGLAATALATFALGFSPAALAQCTTSAWTSTSGTVSATGSGGVKTELEYEGNCGLSVNAASSPGFVTTSAPSNETLMLTRFYIYPEELSLNNGSAEARIFVARGNGNTQLELSIQQLGSGLGLVMKYRSGGTLVTASEVAPLLPTWQAVTVGWAAGNNSGSAYVKIDGREMIDEQGLNNGAEFVSNLDLGLLNDVPGTGKIVMDAFEARRSAPEPPLLTVNELFNIATRADVGAGSNFAVAGFIIEGATQKCVIVRGRGPSINLPGQQLLENPILNLRRPATPGNLASNNDWQNDQNAAVVLATGRAPTDPADAAMYRCLEPGAYTVELKAAGSSALGIGIIEVLDMDEGTPFLFNISTRADVKAGARRAVAGFIINGNVPRQVLIRGRGPSIPLSGTLDDPTLELFSGPTSILSNDNWQEAANVADIAATGRAPGRFLESAILTTLQPGAYTVFLASNTNQTGIGIIEVLDLSGGSIESN